MSKYNISSFFETTLVTSISKTATSAKLTKARDVVTSEILATGDGTDQTYSGNLDANNIEAGTVVITDGVEEFTDDGLGVLTGDAGGTGTIDYTDGAYTLDFNANVGNGTNITANYTTWLIPSTGGILVFDPETSVAEGIEYTSAAALGTTGATLTIPSGGRGLAVIGEKRGTTRKQQKHTAGSVIKLANFHTYLNQLIRVFQGLDGTDDTVFRIGAGADADIYIYAQNADSNKPFIRYDASDNKWFISNNGVDTYDIAAGGSGLTGGEGIVINAGAIDIDLDTNPGLIITAGKIKAKIKANGGLELSADGIYVDVSQDFIFTGIIDISDPTKFKLNNIAFAGTMTALNAIVSGATSDASAYHKHGQTIQVFTSGAAYSAGAALYLKSSDGKVYGTDSDAAESSFAFVGFAAEAATGADQSKAVIVDGIVTGLSSLTPGSTYFTQASAGTIGTTPGTYAMKVGRAISATELWIVKGQKCYMGTFDKSAGQLITASSNYDTAITYGFRPKMIQVWGWAARAADGTKAIHGAGDGYSSVGKSGSHNMAPSIWLDSDTYQGHNQDEIGEPSDVTTKLLGCDIDAGAGRADLTILSVTETGFTFRWANSEGSDFTLYSKFLYIITG